MSTAPARPFPLFRLLVIAGAIFASVTSEFLPTGLLPDMAGELRVSESQIGLLVTVFAGTVVLTTAPLAMLTRPLSRKRLMIATLLVVAVANVAAALAPTYELLMGARILGGLAHGLFWAVTGPYASRIVPRHQLARAVAVTNIGGTLAFVLGVPLGTALGHALGWRAAFAIMGAVVLVLMVLVMVALPAVSHLVPLATGEIPTPVRRDPTLRAVLAVCVTVLLVMIGHNAFYTYIAPWIIEVGRMPGDSVSVLLFVYGGAGAVGVLLAGILGDRFPRATPIGAIAGVAVAVAVLGAVAREPWAIIAMLAVWSIAFGGLPAIFQTRLLHSASPRLRDVASAWLTTSFNIAIGGGALIGGILLDVWGVGWLPAVMTVLVGAGLVFAIATTPKRVPGHTGIIPVQGSRD
ncbi:MFS transporter [Homoserinibacter sp. YIM 151385]|uniref:MFS transporter n=1 Tax=Homoserinibacter sp. YIM 151385 TaxID=2985506 RepID=UPI0022F01199|nr:MFS transporter [Homoserinibacter sp. YIM 151385]WBU36761.1 MFS transporter [Homoserinibacter sp. YIM 151385]